MPGLDDEVIALRLAALAPAIIFIATVFCFGLNKNAAFGFAHMFRHVFRDLILRRNRITGIKTASGPYRRLTDDEISGHQYFIHGKPR